MRKLIWASLIPLFLWGCGERVVDADDRTNDQLLGMWDSVSNSPTVCHERLRINNDKTFWWFDGKTTGAGTYGREEDRLDFMFTTKAWETVRFVVTDRELYLTRTGRTSLYTRVPVTANNSPCPTESKVQ
jgi:hypothetical protein